MNIEKEFKRYRIKTKGKQIFDPIRGKFVRRTPEEAVRHKMICYLLEELNVPREYIGVEKALSSLGLAGNRKRVDICLYSPNGRVLGVIECKAYHIADGEEPYHQALDYISALEATYEFVVDGIEIFAFQYVPRLDQFVKLETVPSFAEMLENADFQNYKITEGEQK